MVVEAFKAKEKGPWTIMFTYLDEPIYIDGIM
jgi:hypothetical protein